MISPLINKVNTSLPILLTFLLTALKAGKAIQKIYVSQIYQTEIKDDQSPLTSADLASNSIINKELAGLQIPILSEENKEIIYENRKDWKEFILVDPLDGTKEFINRNGEFTVNIALIKNNLPVLGVIYAPEPDVLYWGSEEEGSWKLEKASERFDEQNPYRHADRLPSEKHDTHSIRVVASKSHFSKETEAYIKSLEKQNKNIQLVSRGSSLKFCMLAEGSADSYPRPGPTMEWDTAAGHVIAKFAGCIVTVWMGEEELVYNKPDLINPGLIVKHRNSNIRTHLNTHTNF